MKKPALLSLLILLTIVLTAFYPSDNGFNKLWKKAENYQKKGLPKSAIKVVDEIYTLAKKENNNPQVVKVLLFKAGLISSFEEDYLVKSIKTFEQETENAETPEKQILYTLTAELYHQYFSNNRYKILQRKQLTEPDNDIKTWDAVEFNKIIKKYYLRSLEPEEALKSISLKAYDAILKPADSNSYKYRPTLYDLLATRAISYFSKNDYRTFDFERISATVSDSLLVPAKQFVNLNIKPANNTGQILKIYQHLIKIHLNDSEPAVLVDFDLARIDFIAGKYPVRVQKQRELLKQLYQKYKADDISVRIALSLALNYELEETVFVPHVTNSTMSNFSLVKAHDLCVEAVKLHPDAPFANSCRNLITRIERSSIALETEKQLLPSQPFLAKIDFKNTTRLYLKIVKADAEEVMLNPERNIREWINNQKYLLNPGVRNWEINLPDTKDYQRHTTEIKIDGLPLGSYFIYASTDKDFKNSQQLGTSLIHVTNLSFITKPKEGQTEFLVLNRKTGEGIKDVKGDIYNIRYHHGKNRIEKTGSFVTAENGFANDGSADRSYGYNTIVRLIKGADTLYETSYLYRTGHKNPNPLVNIHLFTDRSIYRPGQTVYYKGIVVQKEEDNFSVLKNYETSISLKNSNSKTVSSRKVVSNEFGSFSGSFVIPTGVLNGVMRLRTYHGVISFSVEEYKRPTFLVEFDTLSDSYKYNDEVTITGKVNYYNGTPVSGAKVSYRVTRQNYFPVPWYWYRPVSSPETEIVNGEIKTDDQGNFSVSFKAIPGEKNQASTFNLYADVTDITGEVHSGNTAVKISNRALWIAFDAPKQLDKNDSPKIKIAATNTAGKPLPVSGKLTIYSLQQPDRIFISRLWSEPDTFVISKEAYRKDFSQFAYKDENNPEKWPSKLVLSKNLSWNGDTTLPTSMIQSLKPGYYKFVFVSKGKADDSLTTLIFNSKSKKPAVKKEFWACLSKTSAEPGETVQMIIASAGKNTRVYYELTVKNKVVDKRWIKLNKKQITLPITIQKAWRGGVRINLVSIKNNRRYSFVERISVPFSNKKLKIQLQTYRDHLTPGNKETWSVKISGYKGDNVAAELLAAMYDESLDQIKSHQWSFNLFHQYSYGNGWSARQFPTARFITINNIRPEYLKEFAIRYPEVNWFGMPYGNDDYGIYSMVGSVPGVRGGRNKSLSRNEVMIVDNEMDMDSDGEEIIPTTEQSVKPPLPPQNRTTADQPVVLRSDFRETAFFYPQLHTDSTGSVIFSFTTPDALTRWKLMMLAHTADLSSAIEELSFKAYKELMVMPNAPRFVRQGDRLLFSARVTNFSDKEQLVQVNLNFFNPVTNKKLNLFLTRLSTTVGQARITPVKQLRLKAGESAKVSWLIAIPNDINLMAYRIEAASETFSDGEERVIPVLTNRVLVTETMPMYVNARSDKKYQFKKLIDQGKTASLSTLKNFRYTLEFTSNPAWYAIQALPYLSEPTAQSASNLFRAWYANALSGWIVNSTPKIKAVFESWKINSPDAFLSALQKNQELKNTVLEETPWVMEAQNESEQKRRIALLFDLNNLKNRQRNTLDKLQQLQLGSGAWSWFKGMRDDRYTTQAIVLGMAKLLDKGVVSLDEPGVKNMLNRAVSYLDKKIKEDYKKLKKQPKVRMDKKHISAAQIQYLYARTLLMDKFAMNKRYQKAFDYYLGQAKKYWLKENNYLQAMISVVMFENSMRNEAEAILRSLEERSLYSDELGMYWRSEHGWHWYQAPVETEAMIIEAFSRLNYNPPNIDKMKIWLLKQKQTQRWATSSATTEAVSALLMTGNRSLLTETKPVSIKLGGKPLVLEEKNSNPEAGTGYFKKSWAGNEVNASMGNIEVNNPNNHITWGAAYWQYFENIDKVTASKSPLNIEKKLYIETVTENGPVLEDIANKKLRAGDKIVVRLIIRSDRDMEFVELKDVRATGMEVTNQLSGYSYSHGLGYYRNNKDASTSFFFRYLNRGTYVLEYAVHLTQQGTFPVGLASIQSLYAPEFSAHSQGEQIEVAE